MRTVRAARVTLGLLAALCSLIAGADLPAASANDSGTLASTDTLSIGGAEIDVAFESGDLGLPRSSLLSWVRKSACAVTEYYGRFPVQKVSVRIAPIGEGSGVLAGRTIVIARVPQTRVAVSQFATDASLHDDWIMTHEMVHLAFPSVPRPSTTGSRKGLPPMSSRSPALKSGTLRARESGAIWLTAFRGDCPPPAIRAWITLIPGAELIGAVRCSA
jgi:hypothetical protein